MSRTDHEIETEALFERVSLEMRIAQAKHSVLAEYQAKSLFLQCVVYVQLARDRLQSLARKESSSLGIPQGQPFSLGNSTESSEDRVDVSLSDLLFEGKDNEEILQSIKPRLEIIGRELPRQDESISNKAGVVTLSQQQMGGVLSGKSEINGDFLSDIDELVPQESSAEKSLSASQLVEATGAEWNKRRRLSDSQGPGDASQQAGIAGREESVTPDYIPGFEPVGYSQQ